MAKTVIDAFLNAGWNVKGTVRSTAKAEHLRSRYPDHADKLELVEVPDLVTGEGLEEAVKGVDAIAHTASPYTFTFTDPIKDLIDPAVKGTLSVLKAAKWRDYTYTSADWNPSTIDDVHDLPPPGVYSLSKKLAEEAAHKYATENGLVLSSVNPPMIYGPPLQKIAKRDEVNTSSAAIYALIHGDEGREVPWNRLPLFAHVADVALAHVRALEAEDEKVAGKRFLICGGSFTWEDATSLLASKRPDLRPRLPKLPPSPEQYKDAGKPIAVLDTTEAKETLGIKEFKGWEETLLATIDALVEIEKRFA
ncbi:hypothetical protein JCM10450v2_000562 [Rhodotorula kratochvilovae]